MIAYFRVLKYLEDEGETVDIKADNEDLFRLEDDGSGVVIKDWNVSGVTEPAETDLPTQANTDTWLTALLDVNKVPQADIDSITTVANCKAIIQKLCDECNLTT